MPTLTIHFEKLKKRFSHLNQDVLDSFIQQHGKLTEVFSEALENFLLAHHLKNQGETMFVQPTETTPVAKNILQIAPLPNAKQKESYQFSTANLGAVKEVSFSAECGLTFNAETQVIEGVPTIGGQDISLLFSFTDGSQQSSTLYINADPRSLWNNIPSQDLVKEHWKPDSASLQEITPFGQLIGARMRGRSHAHKGTCCDDDFTFAFHQPTGIHFIAVADGAGSAEYSRLGSKLAVNAAKEMFFEILNDVENGLNKLPQLADDSEDLERIATGLLYNAVKSAYQAQREAINEKITEKSLSCTLLLAFSFPLQSGKWFTAAYWVGDGAVAMFNPNNNELLLLGESDGGQYSGETQFLSKVEFEDEAWKTRIKMSLSEQSPVLFVMTDGVSDPKFKSDMALSQGEHWATLWEELQTPLSQAQPEQALEQWLDFWSVGEHDDRTLAMFIPNHDQFAKNVSESTACQAEEMAEETKAEQSTETTDVETEIAQITITLQKESDLAHQTISEQAVENVENSANLPSVNLPESGNTGGTQ